ncbi:alpha/beta hydrolase [Streptomyces nitrosporeus]|uniref:Alpha/beta hydrolase n=1 Tax=Streptomyces nitrosporeus TaxID=28894 RepID=A0A5J6FKN9_9ACTN|nr:alpha/beta hydrolase [Streptomyces nitrosporeus]QEU76616.1 alpha/beta hydrolase [Streptomyces nitrosporeus]
MTTYARTRTALLLAAVTAASALTAVAFAPAAGAAGAGGTPALVWGPCEPAGGPAGRECARLPVPLDYSDPSGPQVTLAVTRLRAQGPAPRRGTLLAVPGGPGGSGVQRVTERGEALRSETEGRYDIVGFDPRGVGGSTKGSCSLAEEDRYMLTLRSWPAPDGGIDENATRSRRVAAACARNGGPVVRGFTSENQARDMDRLRRALGERKVSVWATSYGAYTTALYAQHFPRRTDRLVLDSSGDPDPDRLARGWLANMARGAEDRFPDFAAWAADPPAGHRGLRLAERPEDVRPLVTDLAARLDRAPRRAVNSDLPLNGNALRQALQSALYGDGAFAGFAALVKEAADPDGSPVLPPELAGPLPDTDAAVTIAVICNDVRWPASVEGYRSAVAADRAAHPLTAGMPANITPCAFWKDAPTGRATRITGEGPSNILMIQSLRDPATPYTGALKMRAALGDKARMVTTGRGGHGVYVPGRGACSDRAVAAFLNDGQRPAHDTHCAD